jgi:uncharacterized protein
VSKWRAGVEKLTAGIKQAWRGTPAPAAVDCRSRVEVQRERFDRARLGRPASQYGRDGDRPRGFASMDRTEQHNIASKGGKAAHQKGTAHEWTSEEAREAGRKGGSRTGAGRKASIEKVKDYSLTDVFASYKHPKLLEQLYSLLTTKTKDAVLVLPRVDKEHMVAISNRLHSSRYLFATLGVLGPDVRFTARYHKRLREVHIRVVPTSCPALRNPLSPVSNQRS